MQPIFSRLLNLETRIGMMIDRTDYLQKIIKKELIIMSAIDRIAASSHTKNTNRRYDDHQGKTKFRIRLCG